MDLTLPPNLLLQDRYHIVGVIGGGGFSEVFEVKDEQTGTLKVLKVLNLSGFRQPQVKQKAIALFQREAEFLSQFRHPGVPLVEPDGYFVWSWDDQISMHCLVMEKIPGTDLQTWTHQQDKPPLTQAQAISWMRQLVDILANLHQRQFFHRDIKPSNIMRRPDGQLTLIDFGAVREITETYLKQQEYQQTGTAIVSAGYTPPEQAEGQAVLQSDFFALGRTFVYLFTGTDPLHLPRDSQLGQLRWRDRAPHISPALADLIDHLMALFPGQRPQTCAAITQTLEQIERSSQHKLPLIQGFYRNSLPHLKDQPRASRVQLALTGLFLLTGTLGWNQRLPISETLNDRGLIAAEINQQDIAHRFYQLALLLDPANPATLYNLGDLYETRQQFDRARQQYKKAIQVGSIEAYNNLARLHILNQEYEQAVSLLQTGLQQAETSRERYALLKNMGWAHLGQAQFDEAQQVLGAAIDLDLVQGEAQCLMAQVLEAKADPTDGLNMWKDCLQYVGNTQNPDTQKPEVRVWISLARRTLKQSPRVEP